MQPGGASAHYQPQQARYKVLIIDEVHMLSSAAFKCISENVGRATTSCNFYWRRRNDAQNTAYDFIKMPGIRF